MPVGKYAKSALEKLGIWASVEKKFAMADNVRAALALVSRGEAVLGIVYETDAKVEPGVPRLDLASVSYTMPSTASPRATSASAARTLSAIANFFSTEAQIPSFSNALWRICRPDRR